MYKPAVPLLTLCPATAAPGLVVYQTATEGLVEGSLEMLKVFPRLKLSAVWWVQWPGTKEKKDNVKLQSNKKTAKF